MKLTFQKTGLLLAVSAMALMPVACGKTDTPETNDTTVTEAEVEPDAVAPAESERRSPEAIRADYEAMQEIAAETSGAGSPALWTLADEDTTIYLFGTVHILRPDVDWRTDEIDAAFKSADKVVFEVDTTSPEGQRAMMSDFLQKGYYAGGQTLSNVLNAEDEAVISAAVESIGMPMAAIDPMEPWMAAVNLSVLKMQQDGFDPASGVEMTLLEEANASGKTLGYLEGAADQAAVFDELPEPFQIQFLYETAVALDMSAEMLDGVVDEWADGDVAGLGAMVASPDVNGGEELYGPLFKERNANWAPQIEAMLDEPGTVFVAVGSGHLAGPDSVITMIRNDGYEVTGP